MSFGTQTQTVDRASQATPFAEDFLKLIQGYVGSLSTPVPGPMQQLGVGNSPQQYDRSLASRVGGINTAGALTDPSQQLIDAVSSASQLRTKRDTAQVRESFGQMGNRFGTSLARVEGQTRNEAGLNLDQIIGSIMMEQAGRAQAAQQFDVGANQQAMLPFLQLASQGIIPQEIIATPGIGSQLLAGGMGALGSFLGAGGTDVLGDLFKKLFGGGSGGGMSGPTAGTPLGGFSPGGMQPRGGLTQPGRTF